MKPRYYIGLAATYHDPAIAIVSPEGNALFAESSERYLQDKRAFNAPPDHLVRVPKLIGEYCDPDADLVLAVSWEKSYVYPMRVITEAAGILDHIFSANSNRNYTWPWPTLETQMLAMTASITMAGRNITGNRRVSNRTTIRYYDHHLCHAATAVYSSPFAKAACAVIDGHGGKQSCAFYAYVNGALRNVKDTLTDGFDFGSLGQFYAVLCNLCGFDSVQGEEWKVMGLASYGRFSEEWYQRLRPLLEVSGLSLTQLTGPRYLRALQNLRGSARQPGQPALEMADLAHTGQYRFCEIMRELLGNFHAKKISNQLVLGGGCALNSSWNGRITQETPFAALHVPMAPGDDGNALGAAWLAFREDHPHARPVPEIHSPYLGSALAVESVQRWVRFNGSGVSHHPQGPHERAAELISDGKIVGWARGRAEYGPRALGNRSILADPRRRGMTNTLNERVKFREEFRPFAPSILHEYGPEWFEHYEETPYMDRTLRFKHDVAQYVPAVVHVDGTGRLQSVRKETAPDYHRLIDCFRQRTGIPMLLNTSFNVMGKPIIHSVEDAVSVFYTTGLDVLVIGDYLVEKEKSNSCAPSCQCEMG